MPCTDGAEELSGCARLHGNLLSEQLLNLELPLPLQDFSQALVWGSNLLFTLRREPALVALNTRHGAESFEWPRRSSPFYRWLHPRAIDLPQGSRMLGPIPSGDRIILRSSGPEATDGGAFSRWTPGPINPISSRLYAVFASNGSLDWKV